MQKVIHKTRDKNYVRRLTAILMFHCDHRCLPLALVNAEGKADWSVEYDAWGNVLSETNPHNLTQLIYRLVATLQPPRRRHINQYPGVSSRLVFRIKKSDQRTCIALLYINTPTYPGRSPVHA
ncbi:RHS domain-containing protein [Citrobacter koseri]|uniref:RHS domain-containing protein n=1 Tax=Citrobacter koseri TaxID=545 RepID=UPI003D1E6E67